LIRFDVGFKQAGLTRRAVAAAELSIGVLGESEILQALAVPSFLLLPGFLFLVTMMLLFQLKIRRPASLDAFPFDAKAPTFWIAAIWISILAAVAYPWIVGRDYLQGYGLDDILWVWFLAGLAGAAVYFGWMRCVASADAKKERDALAAAEEERQRVAARTPASGDEPLEILRKLQRQGLNIVCERRTLRSGGTDLNVFLFQPEEPARTEIWVGPGMTYRFKDATAPVRAELHRALNKAQPEDFDLDEIVAILERAQKDAVANGFDLRWKQTGYFEGPRSEKAILLKPPRVRSRAPIITERD
jgi:hypothetical protein